MNKSKFRSVDEIAAEITKEVQLSNWSTIALINEVAKAIVAEREFIIQTMNQQRLEYSPYSEMKTK